MKTAWLDQRRPHGALPAWLIPDSGYRIDPAPLAGKKRRERLALSRINPLADEIVARSDGVVADPKSLKIALLRLLTQSDLRVNLGMAGKTLVQGSFSLDQMGKRYEDLFVRLLEDKP